MSEDHDLKQRQDALQREMDAIERENPNDPRLDDLRRQYAESSRRFSPTTEPSEPGQPRRIG